MTQNRFDALDSWRGIAALCVALFHINAPSHFASFGPIQQGGYFIIYFFVLSGFLMAGTYGHRIGTKTELAQFSIRRVGRIYPLHLFMLALFFVWYILEFGSPFAENSAASLALSLTLTNGLGTQLGFGWNPPSWSISTEFAAYMVFAVVVLASGRWRVAAYLGVVAASSIGLYYFTPADAWHRDLIYTCLVGFFSGALAWHIFATVRGWLAARSKLPATLMEIAALVIFAYVMFWPTRSFFEGRYLVSAFMLPTIIIFASERGYISDLLRLRPLVFLGALSYSLYLTHDLVIRTVWGRIDGTVNWMFYGLPDVWRGDLKYLVFTAILICFSIATHRFIEEPARKWSRRQAQTLQAPGADPIVLRSS